MSLLRPTLAYLLCMNVILFASSKEKKNINQNTETIPVVHFEGLYSSLSPSTTAKLNKNKENPIHFKSYYAINSESLSLKKSKLTQDFTSLSSTAFENSFATNASPLEGPANKTVVYELLSGISKKQTADKTYFSQIAFIDSSTVAAMAHTKKESFLLLIDISGNPMKVTSKLAVPVNNPYNRRTTANGNMELFHITPSHSIVIPVNKSREKASKNGILSWKSGAINIPGIWIITPVKNDEKKWAIHNDHISIHYFPSEQFPSKGKNALAVQTAHSDAEGNIWVNFNKGITGVLPLSSGAQKDKPAVYREQLVLYNFNRDYSWYAKSVNDYKELLYTTLENTIDPETQDTTNLKKRFYEHPEAYANQYLEVKRYALYSKLLRKKESALDSNKVYENAEGLWQYVTLELDAPATKKKNKTIDYFGFKLKQFHTLHNGITSGNDSCVYMVTNLGIHKLTYNEKTNTIVLKWSTPYENSFLKNSGQAAASSGTTPSCIAESNEIIFADNAYPQVNLLILDAGKGTVKYKFPLFEQNYGSALEHAVACHDKTIIAGNTFGGSNSIHNIATTEPAEGIMKFNRSANGKWTPDYDWNKMHANTPSNTSAPKISSSGLLYIYHHIADAWQLSAIRTDKADTINPVLFSLTPNWKSIPKMNADNFRSHLSFGPGKSAFIGTMNGLIRIITE